MSNRSLASRTRLLSVLMLLAMLLASLTVGVSAQGARDVNNPPQSPEPQSAQPERIIRTADAKPGIYHIDYLDASYNLDPTKYPIDGSIGFWWWSMLNPASGSYDWARLDNWIKARVDRSSVSTRVGIMIATYEATTAADILSTPNWVIRQNGTVVAATTSSSSKVPGVDHYIDYYHRTNRKHLNGEFDTDASRWVLSNPSAIAFDPAPPADSHYSVDDTLPNRGAAGPALRLGGVNNVNATAAKDPNDTLDIPAMPPELNGKKNVYVQARVHIDTATADPNDHLYMELWDKNGNKLGGTALDINLGNYTAPGATDWQEYQFDVTSFAPEKGVRVAFRVVNDGATPTTFWVDNVQLRVRHLIPKYWDTPYLTAYKSFIQALGARYKNVPTDAPLLGEPRYGLQFIAMGTGTYGESQPTQDVKDWEYNSDFDHVVNAAGLTTSDKWVTFVKNISTEYANAFRGDDGIPARHLLLQYAPRYLSIYERYYTTEHATSLGVGLSHNRLTTDFGSSYMNPDPNTGAYGSFFDMLRLHWTSVPIAMEAYDQDLGCSPVLSYWSIFSALEKHTDYLRTDPALLRNANQAPLYGWVRTYLGKTLQNTPKVWTVMREHRNPAVETCSSHPYQSASAGSRYPQYGNFNFWLYQVEPTDSAGKSLGGKTVAETNDKGADRRYAKEGETSYPDAGLGNCPDKAYSNIYSSNPPSCNPEPYNANLPPLVGQSTNLYDPKTWTGAGKEAWIVRRTDQATGNPYMMFRIDDGYMGPGSQTWKANITVKYFDIGSDKFVVKYDSVSGEKVAGEVQKGNTKALMSVTFTVTDAKFSNRLLGSTDFLIDSRSPAGQNDGNEWVHMVEVEKLEGSLDPTPTPTITPTATPNTGSVEGLAFNDLNKNGKLDVGEPGVAGAVMSLSDLITSDKYQATSGANGVYLFSAVDPGQYTLKQKTAPPGFKPNTTFALIIPVQANSKWTEGTNIGFQSDGSTPTPTPSATPVLDVRSYLPMLLR